MDISIAFDNLDQAFEAMEEVLSAKAKEISLDLWDEVLKRTPQYEGRMAASWTYSINVPLFVDRSALVDNSLGNLGQSYTSVDLLSGEETFSGRRKGDKEAIAYANFASRFNSEQFRLGNTVWIANGVDHGEGPYSSEIENGGVRLRSVNRPGAPVRYAVDAIINRYGLNILGN